MMTAADCILFSGGAPGAEAEFGAVAERYGVEEVNFTFQGHKIARQRGIRVLNHEELQNGDVSLEYVSRLMHRRYTDSPTIRKVLQTLWYQVNNGQEIYVIGAILEDGTVRGGTGWGAEFAKLCNKPLFVFDQEQNAWFKWREDAWSTARTPRRSSRTRTSPAPGPATSATTAARRSTICSAPRSAQRNQRDAPPSSVYGRRSTVDSLQNACRKRQPSCRRPSPVDRRPYAMDTVHQKRSPTLVAHVGGRYSCRLMS